MFQWLHPYNSLQQFWYVINDNERGFFHGIKNAVVTRITIIDRQKAVSYMEDLSEW